MGLDSVQVWLEAWSWAKRMASGEGVRARQGEPWADLWTRAEVNGRVQARAWRQAQVQEGVARAQEAWTQVLVQARAWEVQAWAWTRAQVWAQTRAQTRTWGRLWSKAELPVWLSQTRGEKMEAWEAEARVEAGTPEARERVYIKALALAGAWGWARTGAWKKGESVPSTVADSSTIRSLLFDLHHNGIAHYLWHNSPEGRDDYSCIVDVIAPITRLPFELLQQIFIIVIDEASSPPPMLMQLVCKHWHAILTSTWASLKLDTRTPMDVIARKLERNQWLLDVVVDTDSDCRDFTPSDSAFDAIFTAIEASSRWRSLVVESFPGPADLSEDLVNRHLQRCPNTTMNRFTTFKVKSICETSPLLNGLLHILGTTAGSELTTVEINSPNVIAFLAPAYPSIFQSIKDLSLDTPGIPDPVDLLPHLHQLETFTASHISFPIYQSDVNLPFIHTLRYLTLRAVSIQWMSGRTFHVLEYYILIFPLHRNMLHTFSTTLPNCKHLTFQGSSLDILNGISAHKVSQLSVTCSGSSNRGSQQLVQLSRHILGGCRVAPTILHIGAEATNQAWIKALFFMSNLEELIINSARPTSLGAKVLQSLIVWPTLRGQSAPLCSSLKRLGLKYRRWLRQTERFSLIPDLVYLIKSRERSRYTLESFSVYITGTQEDPLELIEESRMSQKGLQRLANESGITGEEFLELLTTGLVQVTLKALMGPSKMNI